MRRLLFVVAILLAIALPSTLRADDGPDQGWVVATMVRLTATGTRGFVGGGTLTLRYINLDAGTIDDVDTRESNENGVFWLRGVPKPGMYYVTPNADRPNDPTAPCDDSAPFQLEYGQQYVLILCHR